MNEIEDYTQEESNRKYHIAIIGEGAFIGISADIVRELLAGNINIEQLTIEELDKDPKAELFAKVLAMSEISNIIPVNEMLQYVEYLEVAEPDIVGKSFISKKTTPKEVYQTLKQTYLKNYQMLNDYENAILRVGSKRLQKLR